MKSPASMCFKAAAALLIDIITLILFFSSWSILRIELFPAALLAVLISLALVNGAILLSGPLVSRYGTATYTSLLITTLLYFFAVVVCTLVLYLVVRVRTYLLIFFGLTLVYVLILFGLYIAGTNKSGDMHRMAGEKSDTADVTKLLLAVGSAIRSCEEAAGPEAYRRMQDAFTLMEERIRASTPFGRSKKTDVIKAERQILLALSSLQETAAMVSTSPAGAKVCDSLTADMAIIKNMVINREKLMIL